MLLSVRLCFPDDEDIFCPPKREHGFTAVGVRSRTYLPSNKIFGAESQGRRAL